MESRILSPESIGRIERFRGYIEGLADARVGEPLISPELARMAIKVWETLHGSCEGELAVPDVGPGQHGELIFIWKRDEHYLSVEIAPGSPAEFFHRDQGTGMIWDAEFDPNDVDVPGPIAEKLSSFLDQD